MAEFDANQDGQVSLQEYIEQMCDGAYEVIPDQGMVV